VPQWSRCPHRRIDLIDAIKSSGSKLPIRTIQEIKREVDAMRGGGGE